MKAQLAAMGLAGVLLVGCATPPRPVFRPVSQPSTTQAAAQKAMRLVTLLERLSREGAELPGNTPADQRQRMQQVLADLSEVLPMLGGKADSAELQLQFRLIDSSRGQLGGDAKDWPSAPATNTALRAAQHALEIIARDTGQSETLSASFKDLAGRVAELDSVRGATHAAVVGQTVRQISQIVQSLAPGAPTSRPQQ